MDASFNEYDNYDNADDEQIRPPDEVVTERLLEDTRCDFQKQMDEALRLSMQEVVNQEKMNQVYEDEIVNNYLKENTSYHNATNLEKIYLLFQEIADNK